jgi:hypothetical protein
MMIFPEQPPSKDASGFDVVDVVERVVDNGDDETTAMTSLISIRSFIDESKCQGRATATPPFSPRGVRPTTYSVG